MAEYIEKSYNPKQELFDVLQENVLLIELQDCDEVWTNDKLSVLADRISAALDDIAPIKHGKWIVEGYREIETADDKKIRCSICGRVEWRWKSDYCPNCGARMDGE